MSDAGYSNTFRAAAEWYDLDDQRLVQDDVPFYVERASRTAGDVLEIACGTGRVSIPLAQAGHEVWGIDLSDPMLAVFRRKLGELPAEVSRRVHLSPADMCSFDLGRMFPLILIPFRAFQALTTEEQSRACLSRVYEHLAPGGEFIINVFRPHENLGEAWVREESLDFEVTDPRTGYKVRRTHIQRHIDTVNQVLYPDLIYYVSKPDGVEERVVERLALGYFQEEQMRALLLSCGFSIKEEMGYFDGRPISGGPELIFVCTRD